MHGGHAMQTTLRAIAGLCAVRARWLAAYAQPTQRSLVVELNLPGQTQAQRPYDESHALVTAASTYRPGSGWSDLPGVREGSLAVASLLARNGFALLPRWTPLMSSSMLP